MNVTLEIKDLVWMSKQPEKFYPQFEVAWRTNDRRLQPSTALVAANHPT
jgi:hypothetical protein